MQRGRGPHDWGRPQYYGPDTHIHSLIHLHTRHTYTDTEKHRVDNYNNCRSRRASHAALGQFEYRELSLVWVLDASTHATRRKSETEKRIEGTRSSSKRFRKNRKNITEYIRKIAADNLCNYLVLFFSLFFFYLLRGKVRIDFNRIINNKYIRLSTYT